MLQSTMTVAMNTWHTFSVPDYLGWENHHERKKNSSRKSRFSEKISKMLEVEKSLQVKKNKTKK